jgi:teichuronic acid biosynthesis glycosyltransferase TuaG
MCLVTVIIPYFKKKNYIKETLISIIEQSHENLEIIIVNDADHSNQYYLEELKKLDKRIILLKNDNNLGAGFSRNRAIKISRGKYLAFCDADDLWNTFKIEKQIQFMNSNNAKFSYTSFDVIDGSNKIIGERKAKPYTKFNDLIKSCDIGLSTVIIEKKIIDFHKIYFPNIKTKEDYIFWLNLAKKGVEMIGLDQKLSNWRKLNNSLSSSNFQKILDGYKVYRYYMKFNIIKSMFHLFILAFNKFLRR